MANRYGRGKKDRSVQVEWGAGQRQFFASENWIPRVDQRYIGPDLD